MSVCRVLQDSATCGTLDPVMHAYAMYGPWVRWPLDPEFVPFTCALTAALCGKPVLMEEFGGCTALPGRGSHVWRWMVNRFPRSQFMASEEAMAKYVAAVLPRLVAVGATCLPASRATHLLTTSAPIAGATPGKYHSLAPPRRRRRGAAAS